SAASFSSSLSSTSPAFSPSSAASFSSSLSSTSPAFSPSSAASFSSSLSSTSPAFSPSSAASFSSSLSSTSPAFSPSSAASFSSSLSSTSPAFSPSSASSLSSSLSSSAPAFSSFSASSFSSSLSSSAPAFSPCSAWASSSFAALEDAFSTSPMHAKGGGSPQPRAGREGTRGAWGVRSLRFYEDIALVLSSLSSASEDETSDELISNGDGSQEGAESEGADEEETKETRSLPRVPHVRKTQLSPRSSKPGHRPSSSFLVPPLAASSCSCPSSPSLCSSSPSLACSSLACSSLASSSLSPSLARSLPCSPTLFMRAHAPDASSTSPSLRVAGRAGQKRERQAIPWRFRNFPVWPPESRAWAREIREAHLPRLLNPTAFAGIEKSGKTERDFVHAVAQAVFFAPLLKGVLARHQCDRHACVACELGFLLHMLDLARKEEDPFRRVCQSTNLQRLLRDLPRMRRARVFHSCFPSDGNEVARGTFSALARRTRIFCGLLLEHLHEDLKDSSSQVASSFSSPIDFLFHLRDTPGSSAERGDEVDVASEFFLPLRYPHKEISETSCSSSSSLSCSSSAAASFSSCSSTDPGDAPRSPASSLSFAQVLEHSLRVYGVRKRETKRQRESVPCAGSSDGGLREEAAAVSASSRDTVTGEERSVREEKRSREQDIGGRETRNGEEKEQDESPLSAYPPLLFIDSNLESEADAAHWRARVRGRRAPRGVCTPEEAAREGGEEGKRSRPAFLCEEFWVKLQSSGEAGETETLPRVRQERFPGAVHYVLSAVLFCVRSPHSFASSPPRRKSVSLGPGCLPLDSVSHTREALSPPPLVTSSVSSSFALSSSSLPLSPSFSFSTTPSSTSQPSLPSPFSFAVAWSSAASVRRSSSSSAFSSSRSASSPLLPSGAPLSAPLFLSSPGVSASHACLSSSTGEQSNARRSEERLSGSHASCRTRGRQAAASSEEAREVTGGQAKGNSRPADPREAEEERLLLFVRVPESYLETHDVSPSGGPDEFDETRGDSSSSSSLSKVSLGMSGVCTAHARGERSQAGRTEAGRAVDAKISQWGEGEEGDLDASGGEERVVLEKTSSCGAGRLSLNRGGDNDKARKEGKEEEREEERCTAAWSERRKHSSKGTRWLLINDHVLAYVKETTVLDFSRSWKLPVLLQFTRRDCLDASSASSGELREASRTCEGEKGDSSGFAASSVDSEGRSTYRRFFGESGCRREAADALRETTSRAGRTEKPGRLEEPEELFASSVAFHLFQADENISLRPLAAKTPTTFLPLTHDELVALQRRKASPSTTHFGGNTRRGNDFSSPAFSSSSSTPSASALSSSTSPASSPSSSASSPSASPASSASSSPSSSSCFLCGPSCLRVDVERDGSAKRRGTEGRAGTEAIEVARCSVSAERRLPTAVGEAEKIEFNGEGREGSNAKDEEERHTVEPRVEEKKREAKGAATSARKTEHSEDLSSNEEDAYAPVFTPLFSPGVSPEGRDRGAEEKEKPMGWLVALDAEFVAEDLEKEEAVPLVNEFHRVKPVSTQSLALARFSGLRPGDLDLHASQFWLSTKKAIHQKLRYLVDAGCVFVGHGLSQDFRIINLFVPSSQIIDTVELFRLPGRRLLSLKFLAAHLLDLRIQQTTHDSVEDARSALLLYRRYNELRRNGTLEQCIQHLYRIGYSTKWSVPDSPAVLPLSFHCPFSSAHSSLPSSVSFPSSLPLSSSGPVCSRLSPEALPFVLRCGAGRRQQLPSSPPAVGLEREAEEK
ncbi:exonuclease, partial [Toxoplasma gondii ARI]